MLSIPFSFSPLGQSLVLYTKDGVHMGYHKTSYDYGMQDYEYTHPPLPAILGDRWWPQTAKQDGDNICKRFLCNVWKKRNERLNIEGIFNSRNSAPFRKGRLVNGHTTKASNK